MENNNDIETADKDDIGEIEKACKCKLCKKYEIHPMNLRARLNFNPTFAYSTIHSWKNIELKTRKIMQLYFEGSTMAVRHLVP